MGPVPNVPVGIQGGNIALPDNAGGIKDVLFEDFTIYWQWLVAG